MPDTKKKLDYSYVIVALCFLMIFTVQGFNSMIKSLFMVPVSETLNVKRSVFSLNDIFCYATTAIVSIAFGPLQKKFGTRRLIAAGFISLIISVVIYAAAENIFVYYIGSCFLGMGYAWTTTVVVGSVVNRWCRKNQGIILGLVLASNGIGGAVSTQILTPIIHSENTMHGYKNAYLLVAAVLLFAGIIIVAFFKERPKDDVVNISAAEKSDRTHVLWSGISFKTALRQPYFYIMAACTFFTGMMLTGTVGVLAAHLDDTGIDAAFIATAVSIFSLSLAVFKFVAGVLYDRFGLRITVNICTLTGAFIFLILIFVQNSVMGKILSLIYAIIGGIVYPLETVMVPIFVKELFGTRDYNRTLGILDAINVTGFAIGTSVLNLFYDFTGTYRIAFMVYFVMMLFVCIGINIAIKSAKKLAAKTK